MKLLRFLFTARLSFLLCAFLAFAFTILYLSASQHRRALVTQQQPSAGERR